MKFAYVFNPGFFLNFIVIRKLWIKFIGSDLQIVNMYSQLNKKWVNLELELMERKVLAHVECGYASILIPVYTLYCP